MKRIITLLFATIVAFSLFTSCGNSASTNGKSNRQLAKDSIARAKFVKDSIARAEFVKDSIANAERNAEIIKTHKALFNEDKDEFSGFSWVKPKDAPKYRNRNGVFCYFQLEDGRASNFRFVYQYYADDWLFIKNMIFNFDGEQNTTIVPQMETDCGSGGMIWEWCDENVTKDGSSGVTEQFIKDIINAKTVKVKMNGQQYYDTKTLTEQQIKSIKNTYEYYVAMGGKFY